MLIRRINTRSSVSICGRPPSRRDFQRQYPRKPARCQRTSVSGRMIVRTCRIDRNQRYRSYAGAGGGKYHLVGINLTTSALETLMEARTVNNLPPAAPHDDAVRCLLAIELSKKSWIVAVNTPLSDKISRYTLEACDWKGLLDLCERIRTRVAREMKKPVEIISCYEAGYDGFWLHRLLEARRTQLRHRSGKSTG